MVKLFCAIVGVAGSAFSVEVDQDQTVDDLKDAIKTKNKIKLKKVDASALQLFLAKKGKAWLSNDKTGDTVLQSEDVASFEQMRGSWRLNDPKLFGTSVLLTEKVIHVLVVIP
eukprot:jgi/Phyca11/71310/gw1.13.804.1